MLRFCLELTKKQFVKNSANLKLLKIEIFQGGRAKKYFVYFKTDNEEKAYFQLFQASSDYFVSANLVSSELSLSSLALLLQSS